MAEELKPTPPSGDPTTFNDGPDPPPARELGLSEEDPPATRAEVETVDASQATIDIGTSTKPPSGAAVIGAADIQPSRLRLPGEVMLDADTAARFDHKPVTAVRISDNALKLTVHHSDEGFRPYPRFALTFPIYGRQEIEVTVAVYMLRFLLAYETYKQRRVAIIAAKHHDADIEGSTPREAFPERPLAVSAQFAADYPDWEEDLQIW